MTIREDNTAEKYAVVVDQDVCLGAGYCYGSQPQLFREGQLGISALIDGASPASAGGGPIELASADRLEDARRASLACPSGAITIIEVEGK